MSDLRADLLKAVADITRKKGIGFVSLREVARRARVSHGAPAHHFKNKAGLLTALATGGYLSLAKSISEEIARAEAVDPADILEAVGRGYVRFAIGNREQFGIMFRLEMLNEDDPEFIAASDLAYGLLVSTIEACREKGYLAGQSSEVVAVSAWSLVHGFSNLWISGRLADRIAETDPDRLAMLISRLFVEAVLRRNAPLH